MKNKDKAINLFRYIMQLYALKYQVVSDINSQEWVKFVSTIPQDDENIIFNYMDRTIEESEKDTDNVILLQIRKPEFEKTPILPTALQGWVNDGWDNYYQSLVKIEKKIVQNSDQSSDITAENTQIPIDDIPEYIYFDSDKYRVDAFDLFEKERNFWASRQVRIDKTRRLFNELHLKCIELDRDSETIEMMIGQGMLACELGNGKRVNHPVLLKKVSIQFDALNNVITIIDTDNSPEIYTMLLQEIDFINHSAVKTLKEQLVEGYYHPLDRNDTPNFLKSLTHRLHVDSRYAENPEDAMRFDDKLIVFNNPVFFIRKRTGGVVKSIEEIITQLTETGEVSGPLRNLIGENTSQLDEMAELLDVSENLSAISGEDKDILLSKEANREQLEIAKRIELYNAVLVQGPPGTGKTHTIANLMGHFLAQGKSVLVTSHTKKALSVLKEKVAPELQHLCVSVLDENNKDMERSIDGITDYISAHSSLELLDNTEKLKLNRVRIIDDLNDVRNKIFATKHKEFETIVFGGESFSPSQAAKFVYDHKDELAYIPGKVMLGKPLPVTMGDLEMLYKTNTLVSITEEQELNAALPNPNEMPTSQEFSGLINEEATLIQEVKQINSKLENRLTINYNNCSIMLGEESLCKLFNEEALEKLKQYLIETKLENDQSQAWRSHAVLDGKKGGGFKTAWEELITKIQDTSVYASDNVMLLLGKVITGDFTCNQQTITTLIKMKEHLSKGKKLNTLAFLKPKEWMLIYNNVRINDNPIETASDCDVLIGACRLTIKRNEIAILWNELIEKRGGLSFKAFGTEPEQVAISHVSKIKSYLEWYETVYTKIVEMVSEANLNPFVLREKQDYTSALDEVNEAIKVVYRFLPMYIDAAILVYSRLSDNKLKLSIVRDVLTDEKTTNSAICKNLLFAIEDKNPEKYNIYYNELSVLYAKYSYINERERILSRIKAYAPEWAELIKNRIGIHGLADVPANIKDAWKWKQFAGAIDEITAMPFEQLQHKSVVLGAELRRATALLAENLAWYHLICRIEGDISQKQALQGWKLTVKKIGKGTGKTAPSLRKEAQRLMAKCQTAVPAWIMPINKALESLDPKTNKFDIVIIDEASQSDISALAILYLAKKIIIVGDDEQVSPSAIGIDVEKMENLVNMHIKGIIPNAHLYDMKSSLYDIAKTTFPTLMLREHFRCVPNIIGYSNRLSYDYKIKPLRDDSNVVVKPATVSYRVKDGVRNGRRKINNREAKTVVALMLACTEFSEYNNMTFGAISLLGDEQAAVINKLALEKFHPLEYEKRRILCGKASHFQGDERDVIFLSLVDNNEGEAPLRLTGEGTGKATKQRYNVAASRARNQLWAVHSLDVTADLKPGDMRRDLIEYVMNPNSFKEQLNEANAKADSPFELAVVKALKLHGYNIVQQWAVGSYRIDMVAVCGDNKIAIECDGELYHSGEEKIRQDMERQAILERLGWRFIRIRGSEYYRNPEETIKRVISKLSDFEIEPESNVEITEDTSKLKEDVIIRAEQILSEWDAELSLEDENE